MAITPLPTPPSRNDPTNFSARGDAFLGALPAFGTEANELQVDVNAKQVTASNAATTATTQAGIATTKAAEALASQIIASAAAVEAAGLTASYQGALAADPTLDKGGGALAAGDWYVNSTTGFIRVYTGTAWVQGISTVAGVTSLNGQNGALNVKTVNSESLLGSGNVAVQPTLVSGTNIKTIGGNSVLGSGDLSVGSSVTAIASGTIPNGAAIVINSNGTVSAVAAAAGPSTGAVPVTQATSSNRVSTSDPSVVASFDPATRTVVVFYAVAPGQPSAGFVFAINGVISGSTITFASSPLGIFPASINSNISRGLCAVFFPNVSRHVVFFRRDSGDVVSRMVRVENGNLLESSGGGQQLMPGDVVGPRCVYDPVSGLGVLSACNRGNSNAVQVRTITAGTNSISGGPLATVMTGGWDHAPDIARDPVSNQILVFGTGSAAYPRAAVGAISGTSISFGSPTIIEFQEGEPGAYYAIGYSVPENRVFVAYLRQSGSNRLMGALGTVSGTSISFGTPVSFGSDINPVFSTAFYETTGKLYFQQDYAQYRIDISGTSFTAANLSYQASPIVWRGLLIYLQGLDMLLTAGGASFAFDFPAIKTNIAYTTNITQENFLGFSSAAYTNGQTAVVNSVGSTSTNQSGLSAGRKYYVTPGGSLNLNSSLPYAGIAVSATNLVVKG